jgi:hypothetical protein
MTWHSGKPVLGDKISDSLQAIRENFQHLDPLAQAIDDLQTVSELAPVAGELQAVSELAPVAGELQAVSELAPYIQAILASRVVEHNLDVPSSPNGTYVRWENGLQVCWKTDLQLALGAASALEAPWTFPAAFVATPSVRVSISTRTADWVDAADRAKVSGSVGNVSSLPKIFTTIYAFPITDQTFSGSAAVSNCHAFAVGRWK